jgi:hypothetical protein
MLMAYPEGDLEGQAFIAAFREELKKLGRAEGRNIRIDTRWATPRNTESRQEFAKELVALHPDLVLSHGTPSTEALLQETRILPIIFVNVADPIGSGEPSCDPTSAAFRSARKPCRTRNTISGSRGGSARRRSTTRSPISTGTRTASLVSSSEIRTTELGFRSGSTRATPT